MKLAVSTLGQFIELPPGGIKALRATLDDIGLEVKGIEKKSEGGIEDYVLTIETLANRGDHLSVLGIAREISARTLKNVRLPNINVPQQYGKIVAGHSETEMCLGLVFIELEVLSLKLAPDVAAVLNKIGQNVGHHPLVDYLIYVQHEPGQPMHAYDKDKLKGELKVRLSAGGEDFKALNGKEYKLPSNALIVADGVDIAALMGVMGSDGSKVTAATKRAVIEVAVLDPVSVRKAAKAVKISSDASYNFERGVDPAGMPMVVNRLLTLLGDMVRVTGVQYVKESLPKPVKISLPLRKLSEQMNLSIDYADLQNRLKQLGFETAINSNILHTTSPTWRCWDVSSSDCIIEEYSRAFGLNNIIPKLPSLQLEAPPLAASEIYRGKIDNIMLGHGFVEVITSACYSLGERELLAELDPSLADRHVNIANSIDSKYGFMRITPMLHLLRAAIENRKRHVVGIKLMEFCKEFSLTQPRVQDSIQEREILALLVGPTYFDDVYRQRKEREPIYYLTGLFEQLFGYSAMNIVTARSTNKLLHPVRSVDFILSDSGLVLASAGEIHPKLVDKEGDNERYYFGVINLEVMNGIKKPGIVLYPSEYPSIERDITVLISPEELSQTIVSKILELKLPNLVKAQVVDDFQKSGEAQRRVTVTCRFSADDRTLSATEVDEQFACVTKLLS